jgi:hypothetical protein
LSRGGGAAAAGDSYWSGAPNGSGAPNDSGARNAAAPNARPRWHDARRLPRPPRDARRVEPREAAVWIRIDGHWLSGHIQCWFTHGGRWACWLSYQADPAHPTVAALWGLFAYEPGAILSRAAYPTPPEPPRR